MRQELLHGTSCPSSNKKILNCRQTNYHAHVAVGKITEISGEEWNLPGRAGKLQRPLLFCGVALDFALGQCLLQLVNLSLGEVGVVREIQKP
jgi:hypothetical protein